MTETPRVTSDTGELRAELLAAGFTRTGVHDRMGGVGDLLTKAAEIPVRLRRLGDSDALSILMRLLVLGTDVDAAHARTLLSPRLIDLLDEHRLARVTADTLHTSLRVIPHYDDLLIAADRVEDTADFVPGVQRPSSALADLALRHRVQSALDVGTGNGIQALLLSRHADRVVATDINQRALDFAAFNAALNLIDNIEFRLGSFFEPVEGERFDIVVSNPPYVISPETAFVFRDSELAGGRVAERVLQDLPRHLNEGGFGSVLVSWPHEGDDLAATPRRWLDGAGCDAWVFYTAVDDPLTTAATWNRLLSADAEAYAAAIDRWLEYYEREGITSLAYAAIVIRRRTDGANWFCAQPLPGKRTRASEHIQRLFDNQDRIAGIADDALLGLTPVLRPEAHITQVVAITDGALALEEAELRLEEGIGFAADLDPNALAVVRRLDGTRTLEQVAGEVADEAGVPIADARTGAARLGRKLLEFGFAEILG